MQKNNIILMFILTVFFLTALILPYYNAEFGGTSVNYDTNQFKDNVGGEVGETSLVSVISFPIALFQVFFWVITGIPLWLNMVYIVLKIVLAVIVYDKIRGIS